MNSTMVCNWCAAACAAIALSLLSVMPAWAADAPGDIRFERKGDPELNETFPPAVFPHWVHRIRYRCDACHDSLFRMQAGANEITMAMIKKEESCGTCHNGADAFDDGFENCARCHKAAAE